MLNKEIHAILSRSKEWGWVMEPDAQKIFSLYGFKTPKYGVATNAAHALKIAHQIGYPVVAKVVSPAILHKSDVKGVVVGVKDDKTLVATFERFEKLDGFSGMLVSEMVRGIELIIGAKNDHQFGPIILLGMGGVGVEIYKDVALRMAPLQPKDVDGMVCELDARQFLTGYRGSDGINMNALKKLLVNFSRLMMDLQGVVESVDMNPVICTPKTCLAVDARIILKK